MRTPLSIAAICLVCVLATGCSNRGYNSYYSSYGPQGNYYHSGDQRTMAYAPNFSSNFASRLPDKINTKERVVVVDPNRHVWGAYDANGDLVKAGIATAGGDYCPDIGRGCRTSAGSFRVSRIGGSECISKQFPLPNGGGLMPYCMFFSGGQALHGSPDNALAEANLSHGCVRMRIQDAAWLHQNFVQVGTRVIVRPY